MVEIFDFGAPTNTPPKALHAEHSIPSNGISDEKVRFIQVDKFSKWEASRQLAALCRLLLLALSRDFGVHSPEIISIAPSENRGIKLRIIRRD